MSPRPRFYTTKGDDGRTALYSGGRVPKDDPRPEAYGTVDELQAFIGLARAEVADAELDGVLLAVERDLYVLMGELATLPENREKLAGSVVTTEMVERITAVTDEISTRFEIPEGGFALPGQSRVSALLDVARAVARRAERRALPVVEEPSLAIPYLNRLSSLLWAVARWQEGQSIAAKPWRP